MVSHKVTFQLSTHMNPHKSKTIQKQNLKSILKRQYETNVTQSPPVPYDDEVTKLQQICDKQAELLRKQNEIIQRLTKCLADKNQQLEAAHCNSEEVCKNDDNK